MLYYWCFSSGKANLASSAQVIHQPRIEVANLFDELLLMTSGPGRAVYNGKMEDCISLPGLFQKLSQALAFHKGRRRLPAQCRLRSATACQPVGLLYGPGYTGATRRASGHVCAAVPLLGRTSSQDKGS